MHRTRHILPLGLGLLLSLSACTDLGDGGHLGRWGDRRGLSAWDKAAAPGMEPERPHTAKDRLYLSGIRFPEGYDWRKDSLYGSVKAVRFLLEDGVCRVELPLNAGKPFSPDEDMAHIIDGHLYTDYSTDRETILSRDGEEVLRLGGRQMLNGLVRKGEDLWMLCEPRSGSGFTLYCNRSVVFSRSGIKVSRPLRLDDGSVEGAASDARQTGHGLFFSCQEEGRSTLYSGYNPVAPSLDGECMLEAMVGTRPLEVFRYQNRLHLRYDGKTVISTPNLTPIGAAVSEGEFYLCTLNSGGRTRVQTPSDSRDYDCWPTAFRVSRGHVFVLGEQNFKQVVFIDGTQYSLPADSRPYSLQTITSFEGHFYMVLDTPKGPALWHDGEVEQMTMNGYIDKIAICRSDS